MKMKSSNNKFKSALKVDTNTTKTSTLNKEIELKNWEASAPNWSSQVR